MSAVSREIHSGVAASDSAPEPVAWPTLAESDSKGDHVTTDLRDCLARLRSSVDGDGPLALLLLAAVTASRRTNILVSGDKDAVVMSCVDALTNVLGLTVAVVSAGDQEALEMLLRGGQSSPFALSDCVLLTDFEELGIRSSSRLGSAIDESGHVYDAVPGNPTRTEAFLIAQSGVDSQDLRFMDEWLASRFAFACPGPAGPIERHRETSTPPDLAAIRQLMDAIASATSAPALERGMRCFLDTLPEESQGDIRRGFAHLDLWRTLAAVDGSETLLPVQAWAVVGLSSAHVKTAPPSR